MPALEREGEILDLLKSPRSILLISVSGGKDSDVMLIRLWNWAREHGIDGERIHVISAHLGRNEWSFALPHIQELTYDITGKAPIVVERPQGDVLQQWEDRYATLQAQGRTHVAPFSDAKNRFCTSAAKRAQIHKKIIEMFPRDRLIVQAVGIRAEESPHRRKATTLKYLKKSPSAATLNRHVYTWLPIHSFSLQDVWQTLGWTLERLAEFQADVKQKVRAGDYEMLERVCEAWDYRWGRSYALGNTRLSCSLCPLANNNDLLNGIAWNPDHFRDISALERRSGFSFKPKQWLSDLGQSVLNLDEEQELVLAKEKNTLLRQLATPRDPKPKQLNLL